jgi:hypothetical protein
MFVDVAKDIGITSIHHKDYLSTVKAFTQLGLITDKISLTTHDISSTKN